jgi:hypothetical protein
MTTAAHKTSQQRSRRHDVSELHPEKHDESILTRGGITID